MKILHLLSNWKWTERAEPAADLALAQQSLGEDVVFACNKAPADKEENVFNTARSKGLKNVLSLDLPKHLQLFTVYRDTAQLKELISKTSPDVIHCHMPNAHLLAGMARGRNNRPVIIKSSYDPKGPSDSLRSRNVLSRYTDGLVVISEHARSCALSLTGLSKNRVQVAEPGIDLERFNPAKKIENARSTFGLSEEHFVVGLVSRIRESRRIDVALGAVAQLAPQFPQLRLLIAGRGKEGAMEQVITGPASQLGIEDKVITAGYCRDERLATLYRAADVLMYPVPGTDKSCRTVREALASGLPVIASGEGFLPELVKDSQTGIVVGLTVGEFSTALKRLIDDQSLLKKISDKTRSISEERFSTADQAKKTLAFYSEIMNMAGNDES